MQFLFKLGDSLSSLYLTFLSLYNEIQLLLQNTTTKVNMALTKQYADTVILFYYGYYNLTNFRTSSFNEGDCGHHPVGLVTTLV
jgi:hypothetical protein